MLLTRLEEAIEKRKLQGGSKQALNQVTALINALASQIGTFNINSIAPVTPPPSSFQITRTRRPQKFKSDGDCKKKPSKHSAEIDEEDKAETG